MRAAGLALILAVTPLSAQTETEMKHADALPDSTALLEPRRRLTEVERRLAAHPDDTGLLLQRVGAMYLVAVEDEPLVDAGLNAVDSLRGRLADDRDAQIRLDGYHGAFTVLRARHSFWPHHKLSHVRAGLSELDDAVRAAPDDAVLRYLRLMSGFYLPGLFGRGDEVAEDFAALARLLPNATAEFPGPMLATVTRFVLANGTVEPARAHRLEALLDIHE